jgi:Xaa-Pro aminopeptidase
VEVFKARRTALAKKIGEPILFMGVGYRARNLPLTSFPFRQDSTFLYYTGCDVPNAAALIEPCGTTTLFLPIPGPGDALWHGTTPTTEQRRETFGVDAVLCNSTLRKTVSDRALHTLAIPDTERTRLAADLAQTELKFGKVHGSERLVAAVIHDRRVKSSIEIAHMTRAIEHTEAAFRTIMGSTHAGETEAGLTALFEASLAAKGLTTGYATILSQRGEVLHNHHHDLTLENGQLLLVDGGGEVDSGYGCDITRTWPVSGKFSPRQAAVYSAVLQAQEASIALCTPGRPYRDVHDASSRVIAQFLIDEKVIVNCSLDDAVARGAQATFFPHGIGHHLGLDVHDLENFGDIPSYPSGTGRSKQFGTKYLRLNLPLQEGWVVTVEPGFYAVPAILNDTAVIDPLKDIVDFERAREFIGFGGIRLEDDILVTAGEPKNLSEGIPKQIADLEQIVGRGPTVASRFAV